MVTESKKHSVEIWLYSLDITPFLFIFSMVSQAKSWLCSVNLPASFCISHSLPGLSQHTSAAVLIPLSNLLLYQMLAQVTVPANAGHAETVPGGWTGPDSGTLPLLLLLVSIQWPEFPAAILLLSQKRPKPTSEHTCARSLKSEVPLLIVLD